MKWYEMNALLENIHLKNKQFWEMTREICYVTAQCQSSKKIDIDSFMTFPWEKAAEPEDTEEEREEVIREMREMEKIMNSKTYGE